MHLRSCTTAIALFLLAAGSGAAQQAQLATGVPEVSLPPSPRGAAQVQVAAASRSSAAVPTTARP